MVLVDEVIEDRRLNLGVLGWLAFVLWEGYWIWEIAQRYPETKRLQLPYVFLFFILVVIPLAVYSFIRRRIRRSTRRGPHADDLNPDCDACLSSRALNRRFDLTSCAINYSISSSARISTDCGIAIPSAFAVFILIARSKFTGCSTGIEAAGSPFISLSTKSAARR